MSDDVDYSTDDGPMLALVVRKLERVKVERDALRAENERLRDSLRINDLGYELGLDAPTLQNARDAALARESALRESVLALARELYDFVAEPATRHTGEDKVADAIETTRWADSDRVRALLAAPGGES